MPTVILTLYKYMYGIILSNNWKISKNMSSKNKKILARISCLAIVTAFAVNLLVATNTHADDCIVLSYCGADGMTNLARDLLSTLKSGAYIAGGMGVLICGLIWATALDNQGRVGMAKKRLTEIVIGIAVLALFDAITRAFGIG